CFFGTLKSECFYLNKFNNIEELKTALSDYIHYYNNQRISIKLKGLSPVEYRLKVCSHPVRT
ncbi:TPA: integrase core domain-containing protein, partial [Klebsiella pneumoniae]